MTDNSVTARAKFADNEPLSRKSHGRRKARKTKRREANELEAFVKRMFRALVRRSAEGDLEAVEALARLSRSCEAATREAGDAAWRHGYSYTQLADALGVSRQAARQRFTKKELNSAVSGQPERHEA
ncbi:MAG TPA: hypothetical protein VF475_13700 [Sphingobium sp.]